MKIRRLALFPVLFLVSLPGSSSVRLPNAPSSGRSQGSPISNANNSCRLEKLLPKVTSHVKEFVENVNRFSASELLEKEQLDKQGNLREKAKSKSNYIATIQEGKKGVFWVDEFRDETSGSSNLKGSLSVTGAAPALALIFHPSHIEEFNMTCDGLEEWQNRSVWRISFEQRLDRPATLCTFKAGLDLFPMLFKGFALIDSTNYQILYVETDLLQPIPKLHVDLDHMEVGYASVPFNEGDISIWLPQTAEITVDYKGKRLIERHTYSNFRLFLVETGQKIAAPKNLPTEQ
jgi:hypothetical protein